MRNYQKYRARKTEVDGIIFDSRKEADRYVELKILENAGYIKDLQMQVPYELVPTQKGNLRTERAVKYVADFVYSEDGQTVVEDVKGMKTREYIIKRKLMMYLHGIEIREV